MPYVSAAVPMGRPMIAPARPGPRLVRNRGRRGVGDYFSENCLGPASLATVLNPFCYLYPGRNLSASASNIISPYNPPPLPTPIAQPTAYTPTGAVDVAGNPVYDISFQTPQENQAANAAQAQQFFTNLADQNAAGNPSSTAIWLIAGAVLLGGLWLLGGRQ